MAKLHGKINHSTSGKNISKKLLKIDKPNTSCAIIRAVGVKSNVITELYNLEPDVEEEKFPIDLNLDQIEDSEE
jgi:hypothetical protein